MTSGSALTLEYEALLMKSASVPMPANTPSTYAIPPPFLVCQQKMTTAMRTREPKRDTLKLLARRVLTARLFHNEAGSARAALRSRWQRSSYWLAHRCCGWSAPSRCNLWKAIQRDRSRRCNLNYDPVEFDSRGARPASRQAVHPHTVAPQIFPVWGSPGVEAQRGQCFQHKVAAGRSVPPCWPRRPARCC